MSGRVSGSSGSRLAAQPHRRESLIRKFARDDQGGMSIFFVVTFIAIVLTTGIALDLLRHEGERAELQDALDRGVLAASSLSQTEDATEVVRSYLQHGNYNKSDGVLRVVVSDGDNHRSVSAVADVTMHTDFLRMAGLKTLPIKPGSSASEGREEVEISLALDISGSMAREHDPESGLSRLEIMRGAASSFVDKMLAGDRADATTLSLIPFAGQVNAGPLFDRYNALRVHSNSSCIEFNDGDFATRGLPGVGLRPQVPHFQWFSFEGNRGHEADWGWCPNDTKPILPFSNDAGLLKQRIEALVGHDGTGTQIGMKWALGLLDPTSRSAIDGLIDDSVVPEDVRGRPFDYDRDGAMKVIVLMTDGNIRYQQRPRGTSEWLLDTDLLRNQDETRRTTQFGQLCNLAKEKKIVIFTIGFDVPVGSPAYTEMMGCATSPSHFYHVNGLELDEAFKSIAATISKLKLVG